jgi:hypothetical protein
MGSRIRHACTMSVLTVAITVTMGLHASAQSDHERQAAKDASLRLKKAAINRSLEDCEAKGGSADSCNSLLEVTHQRELKVIDHLKSALSDPRLNAEEMNREFNACYNPHYGYVETIECWSQLSDRFDAARSGRSLLKGATPAATGGRADPATLVGVYPMDVDAKWNPLSPDTIWRDCMDDLTKQEPILRARQLEAICRDALHLPWYSHTWLESHKEIVLGVASMLMVAGILSGVVRLRRKKSQSGETPTLGAVLDTLGNVPRSNSPDDRPNRHA